MSLSSTSSIATTVMTTFPTMTTTMLVGMLKTQSNKMEMELARQRHLDG